MLETLALMAFLNTAEPEARPLTTPVTENGLLEMRRRGGFRGFRSFGGRGSMGREFRRQQRRCIRPDGTRRNLPSCQGGFAAPSEPRLLW